MTREANMSGRAGSRGEITGWHVLTTLLVSFGIVIAVNGIFVYQAIATFTGTSSDDPYRRGLAYNATLAEAEAQDRLGWRSELGLSQDGRRLSLAVNDAQGQPVTGLALTGNLERPATNRFDTPLTFRAEGAGRYVAELALAGRGSWIATVSGSRTGGAVVYRWRKRLWLKPEG